MLLHRFLHLIYATFGLARVHLVLPSWFLKSSFFMYRLRGMVSVKIVLSSLVASDSSGVFHHSRLNFGVFFRHNWILLLQLRIWFVFPAAQTRLHCLRKTTIVPSKRHFAKGLLPVQCRLSSRVRLHLLVQVLLCSLHKPAKSNLMNGFFDAVFG